MVVDIQHFRQLCQLEDEYAHEPSEVFHQEAPKLIANVVTESPKQKRKRNKKAKYSPSDDTKDNVSANLVAMFKLNLVQVVQVGTARTLITSCFILSTIY